jgi:hypothetical protein
MKTKVVSQNFLYLPTDFVEIRIGDALGEEIHGLFRYLLVKLFVR